MSKAKTYSIEKAKPAASVPAFELKSLNPEQADYIRAIKAFPVVLALGAAGSGKTFIATVLAAQRLKRGDVKQIVLVRPNEPLGPSLGMLKGDLFEKLKPWMEPFLPGLMTCFTREEIQKMMDPTVAKIEMVAVEHLRGRSFGDCDVIADETQNLKYEAMKCLLTRIGENSKLVLCGDIKQQDIKDAHTGLDLLLDIGDLSGKKPLKIIELVHCVRSEVASFFLEAIEILENDQDD